MWAAEVGHHQRDLRCSEVDLEVAARRRVCRTSRLPCSRCTCTDAGTDAASPCRRRRWRRGRSDCPTSSARSDASCVSPPRCDDKPSRTPSCRKSWNTLNNMQTFIHRKRGYYTSLLARKAAATSERSTKHITTKTNKEKRKNYAQIGWTSEQCYHTNEL